MFLEIYELLGLFNLKCNLLQQIISSSQRQGAVYILPVFFEEVFCLMDQNEKVEIEVP